MAMVPGKANQMVPICSYDEIHSISYNELLDIGARKDQRCLKSYISMYGWDIYVTSKYIHLNLTLNIIELYVVGCVFFFISTLFGFDLYSTADFNAFYWCCSGNQHLEYIWKNHLWNGNTFPRGQQVNCATFLVGRGTR